MQDKKEKKGHYIVDVSELDLSDELLNKMAQDIQKLVASSIIGSSRSLFDVPLKFTHPIGHTEGIIARREFV